MNLSKSIFFLFFTFLTISLSAQTADEIVAKYFENTGGIDKWSKITSIKSTAKIKAQGMEFPAIILQKPMKQKISFTFQGITIVQPAFDGTTGWHKQTPIPSS